MAAETEERASVKPAHNRFISERGSVKPAHNRFISDNL